MQQIRILWVILFLAGSFCGSAYAQLQLFPLPTSAETFSLLRKHTESDTVLLNLPFFDDFSYGPGLPDPRRWAVNDSVPVVSTTLGIDPPSMGVAVFDGADARGRPYDFVNSFRNGSADRLISHFFDLSDERPSDSLYISFYWQAEGLGEPPTSADSLKLQMIDQNGAWRNIWAMAGRGEAEPFAFVQIAIENAEFLHAHSRFRFINEGRLGGPFDTWAVDYVQFYRKRDFTGRWIDLAINQQPSSLLKNYRHMPMNQFLADPNGSVADSVFSGINNVSDTFNLFSPRMVLSDLATGELFATRPVGAIGIASGFGGTNLIQNREQMQLIGLNNLDFIDNRYDSLDLVCTFYFDSLRAEAFPVTRPNDTTRLVTTLKDFYAYDDGSAEYAVGIFQRFGRVAYRFVLNEPDLLAAIDIHLPRIGASLAGQTFNVMVWQHIDSLDDRNDVVLLRQNIPFVYSEGVNTFNRIPLSRTLLVSDTVYVGYQQLTDNPVTVGYDRNTDSGDEIFFNVSSRWRQNADIRGSLMIRPVFMGTQDPSATAIATEAPEIQVFPNPASHTLKVSGPVTQWQLIDLSGRVWAAGENTVQHTEFAVPVSHLPRGMYLLQLIHGQGTSVKKVMLSH